MPAARKPIDLQDLPREVSLIESAIEETVTIALAAGAANVMTITVQVVDGFGKNVAGIRYLDLFMSGSPVGAAITATAYSGSLVASTGAILATPVAAKMFSIVTDATGKFIGGLTATAKPATEYVAIVRQRGTLKVSAASGANWG